MFIKEKWIVLWSLWVSSLVRQPTAPILVSNGWIQGAIARDGSHYRYLGIPYATSSRERRFQPSQPEPKWTGTRDFDDENIRCFQRFTRNYQSGREDCLKLNVYTPINHNQELLPVMVFIHGGGFRDGSGSPFLYGPQYLLKHGVILVTFNYRLEILGFLCLGIKEAPGNIGLRDQVDALKWIKRNIKSFGGDPDNVTIFGESAGSASVMYHILSPMSAGLFQKGIMQSGSAMSPWSYQYEPLDTASRLAEQMGYKTRDPIELHKIFFNKTAEELLRTRVPRTVGDVVLSENIFVPCLDNAVPGIKPFLPESPYDLITKGKYNKVPLIIGYNDEEGYMFVGKENKSTIANFDFYHSLPRDLDVSSEKEKNTIAKRLRDFFIGDDSITLQKLAKYEGDIGITYPVISTIELLLKTSNVPIYTYKFSYDSLLNIAKIMYGFRKESGATHADELFYIFKLRVPLPQAFLEMEAIDRVSTMWTNFAKFGNPTPSKMSPKWLPTDRKNPRTFIIDRQLSTVPLWDRESLLYLNATYSKYRRK